MAYTGMQNIRDNPGVIVPPPLLAVATIVLGLFFDWLLPAYVLTLLLSVAVRVILGLLPIGAGLALVVFANLAIPVCRHACGTVEAIPCSGH